jgi:hypothetical protein
MKYPYSEDQGTSYKNDKSQKNHQTMTKNGVEEKVRKVDPSFQRTVVGLVEV